MIRLLLKSCFPNSLRKLPYSTSANPSANLALHFLKNSCHLPEETALLVSKKINLKRTATPHAVLSLLRSYNFSEADIKKAVSLFPNLLLKNPVKTLKPKFEFFEKIGFSNAALIQLFTCVPQLFQYSLKNKLLPNYRLLKDILHTDAKVISAIRSCAVILKSDLRKTLPPKVKILEDNGVSVNVIHKILTKHNRHLVESPSRFDEILEFVKKTGISPKSAMYAHAFAVLSVVRQNRWDMRVENFKKLGWSEEQVMIAFVKHPYCMAVSIDKVTRTFKFYKEKFGWDSDYVSKNSNVLSHSFEKRVLARYRILNILQCKGLYCGKVGVMQLKLGERDFLLKYVVKNCKQVPELIDDDVKCKLEEFGLSIENN